MLIRYRRDRFTESLSRSRISLDSYIAAVAVNRTFMSVIDDTTIGVAVLEVKGATDEFPLAIRPLLQLGLHKRSVLEISGGLFAHDARIFLVESKCSSS